MADKNLWSNYTEKDTLTDKDEVMIYDSVGKTNKRSLMEKFWDYVVEKMATAVISKLETENKTVIGALNYLNGNIIPKRHELTISEYVISYDKNNTYCYSVGKIVICSLNIKITARTYSGSEIIVDGFPKSNIVPCVPFVDGKKTYQFKVRTDGALKTDGIMSIEESYISTNFSYVLL